LRKKHVDLLGKHKKIETTFCFLRFSITSGLKFSGHALRSRTHYSSPPGRENPFLDGILWVPRFILAEILQSRVTKVKKMEVKWKEMLPKN